MSVRTGANGTIATAGFDLRAHPIAIGIGAAAAACAVLGVAAIEHGQLRGDSPPSVAAFMVASGISFVAAGLVASFRRPERWTGTLMVATGFVLYAGTLIQANRSLPFTIGLLLGPLPAAALAHLVLAFPDGRLHSIWERLIVWVAYLNATVVQVVMLMFMPIEAVTGCPCPHNLLFARDDMAFHTRLMRFERNVGLAVAAAVVLVLVVRWIRASSPLRRALLPILVTGGVAYVLIAATQLASSLPDAVDPYKLFNAQEVAIGLVPIAYLVGLFRTRMGLVGVSDLIVELSQGLEAGRLRDALARALRDPSLELGYWIRDPDGYVDVHGRTVGVVPPSGRAVTLLERHGRKVAALVHDQALNEDQALLDAVSSAAGLALENERLLVELRAQLEEVKDSRARIVEAGMSERRRLERNLHDGAQQRLVTLSLHLRMAQETLHDDPLAAEGMLAGIGNDLKQALDELRELARGLHPAVLTDRGLAPALHSLAGRSPFPVKVSDVPALRLPEAIEAAVYFVVAESLTNAAKHSGATAGRIVLSTTAKTVVVEIGDNGRGGASVSAGTGLRGLADRVEALGGTLRVQSDAGGGTAVRAELPLD